MFRTFRKTAHAHNKNEGQGYEETEVNDTLNVFDFGQTRTPTLVIENHPADSRVKICEGGIVQTLSGRMGTGGGNVPLLMRGDDEMNGVSSVVRRLTPLECERLQGYPDGWTDIGDWKDSNGKVHKCADSNRYKALGNSIALPYWAELAKAVVSKYDYPITMGSLFDGIGGFPLVFERAGAKAIWASEIEEFPIAVTKVRFPE